MVTQGRLLMSQHKRLQEERPRRGERGKAQRQRKDRESAHLARQHKVPFEGGQKAKGAYGVFASEEEAELQESLQADSEELEAEQRW